MIPGGMSEIKESKIRNVITVEFLTSVTHTDHTRKFHAKLTVRGLDSIERWGEREELVIGLDQKVKEEDAMTVAMFHLQQWDGMGRPVSQS